MLNTYTHHFEIVFVSIAGNENDETADAEKRLMSCFDTVPTTRLSKAIQRQTNIKTVAWLSGKALVSINEVTLRRAALGSNDNETKYKEYTNAIKKQEKFTQLLKP